RSTTSRQYQFLSPRTRLSVLPSISPSTRTSCMLSSGRPRTLPAMRGSIRLTLSSHTLAECVTEIRESAAMRPHTCQCSSGPDPETVKPDPPIAIAALEPRQSASRWHGQLEDRPGVHWLEAE